MQHFGGDSNDTGGSDDKIDFTYAARLMYAWTDRISLALEAYGTVERIGDSGAPSADHAILGDFNQHRAGPVVYWSWPLAGLPDCNLRSEKGASADPEAKMGLGALFGLNEHTPDATLKVSFEVVF